jgi:hypothetical protein
LNVQEKAWDPFIIDDKCDSSDNCSERHLITELHGASCRDDKETNKWGTVRQGMRDGKRAARRFRR